MNHYRGVMLTECLVVISCFVGPDECLNFHHFINLGFQKISEETGYCSK